MANKMLIDATHPEETRVVVVRGSRVEEFDFESANRKQLRGNIYLAKVTRVEPSLQAAFVEYGGNRHGFLAFSEIHPDYYQIPVADRQALIAEDEKAQAEEDKAEEKPAGARRRGRGRARPKAASADGEDVVSAEAGAKPVEPESSFDAEAAVAEHVSEQEEKVEESDSDEEDHPVESIGAGDALEEMPERSYRRNIRSYKIQEVIKRRQILLIQVVKEERGSKGAALTTYLSLAGRYSVLMPNTARGGGISRKITSAQDRKRLKDLVSDLDVPEGMGVILRTAGASRTRPEIKRDFEYLMRLWETVRDLTLKSTAPALVYEEGSLIKRSIRDLYNKDIDEVLVAGEDGYREAKDFMRMLMPSNAKTVQPYRDSQPLYSKMGVEAQLDAMFSNTVTMKSGGYLVINQAEALVAIDVNSGRSTREHNIEDTALRTNMEAAEEVARQLRLRDLAGLIVIDFIDMEESRNNRAVEKKLKDCLKDDRARIQLGRISHFGLMEMSRQRIRTGVLESSSEVCPLCSGVGTVRSVPSVALHVLRIVEDHLRKDNSRNLLVKTRSEVALYVLNQKRGHIREIESRFGVVVVFSADEHLAPGQHAIVERTDPASGEARAPVTQVQVDSILPDETDDEVEDVVVEDAAEEHVEAPRSAAASAEEDDALEGGNGRRRRRRRRRRGGRGGERDGVLGADEGTEEDGEDAEAKASDVSDEVKPAVTAAEPDESGEEVATDSSEDEAGKRRRRGRRGGRRNRRGEQDDAVAEDGEPAANVPSGDLSDAEVQEEQIVAVEAAVLTPETEAPEEESSASIAKDGPTVASAEVVTSPAPLASEPEPEAPKAIEQYVQPEPAADAPARPRRTGWWSRKAAGE
ncbi:Rne/Rng family ribonuclease [Hansschlegelia plantiphila]|uniref:Ribonuclease E n=1 Tax=Hansschlegelia plantiphila TaxID=374655 RepID=A0A9W6J199_9HYPH|nr:Rne/Rng family ribonuclease [Hansschlegelia plantiphila]GLK67430.1 ribonuclease E [Hansschlegelia plantiphila]